MHELSRRMGIYRTTFLLTLANSASNRTSSDHTSMDGLEVGPARFFHSCQPVGIDAFKVVRFSFPVISEFLTPFTTIVPDVGKRYHIGVVVKQIDAPEIAITDINLVG